MLLALQKSNREFSLRRLLGIPFRCIVITISCGVLRLRRFSASRRIAPLRMTGCTENRRPTLHYER